MQHDKFIKDFYIDYLQWHIDCTSSLWLYKCILSAASGTGSPNSASIEFEISATSSVAQCAMVDFDLECRAEHCRVDDYYITCRRLKFTQPSPLPIQCK